VRPLVRLRARAGTTLIELIVSIMILTTGVLALASTAPVILRQMGGAQLQSLVGTTAHSRFEQMRAVPCGGLANGDAEGPSTITETWTVAALTRARLVRDSVAYTIGGEEKFQIFVTIIPCTAAT
jgi:Tfp pilus assembly protein PilV